MPKRKQPPDPAHVADLRAMFREMVPNASKTIRAQLQPDGAWTITPYGPLARRTFRIDPNARTVEGFTELFAGHMKMRKNGLPIYLPWCLSPRECLKHGRGGIKALSTFSGISLGKVMPFVKREALNKVPPLVRRVLARVHVESFCDKMISFVWWHEEEFRELDEKCPALLPVALSWYHRDKDLPDVKSVRMDVLHADLLRRGMTKSEWRYLVKMPIRGVRDVLRHVDGDLTEFMWMVRLFARTQEPIRSGVVHGLCQRIEFRRNDHCNERFVTTNAIVLRTFFREARRARKLRRFTEEFLDVLDYVRGQMDVILAMDANQLSVPLHVWKRRSREWHNRPRGYWAIEERIREGPDQTWETGLPVYEGKTFTAVALTTSAALRAEGEAMHHCVAQYDGACVSGRSQIFSIRKGKENVATCELAIGASRVTVAQVKGTCNSVPSDSIVRFCGRLAFGYKKMLQPQPEEFPVLAAV